MYEHPEFCSHVWSGEIKPATVQHNVENDDMETDGFIMVEKNIESVESSTPMSPQHHYLEDIDHIIRSLQASLWTLNTTIHDNPELAFREYKTHDVLTNYIRSQTGWEITTSAYGLETAWVAKYDSGRRGPVVSFNAEMGTLPFQVFHCEAYNQSNRT